jgi:hypothetical protein
MLIEEMVRPYICSGGWNSFFTSTPQSMILEKEEVEEEEKEGGGGGLIKFYTWF